VTQPCGSRAAAAFDSVPGMEFIDLGIDLTRHEEHYPYGYTDGQNSNFRENFCRHMILPRDEPQRIRRSLS
jgi:hypothetical protein